MRITDTAKYQNIPGYQQVCREIGKYPAYHNGSLRPTTDKSFHTFTVKPCGQPFSLYPPARYVFLLPLLLLIGLVAIANILSTALYIALSIACMFLLVWRLEHIGRTPVQKGKPVITVNKQWIMLNKEAYLWNDIINTFIFERPSPYKRQPDFHLVILTKHHQLVRQHLNHFFFPITDSVGELAIVITYFMENYAAETRIISSPTDK